MEFEHVTGKNAGDIKVFALSTCPWCKKAKKLLDDLGVDYYFSDVDLLTDEARNEAVAAVHKWNPAGSFPTIIINNSLSIVGFREDEIREALGEAAKA